MNLEQYTDRARAVLQDAQNAALNANHQQLTPTHLLASLLADSDQFSANLIRAAGGDPHAVQSATEAALKRIPAVTGGDGRLYADPQMARVLAGAEKSAKQAGDAFVTLERLLLALAELKSDAAGDALRGAGVKVRALQQAIDELRQGRTANSQNAEEGYEALKKYTRDLTADARAGKLDPVIGRDEEIRRTVQVLSRRTKNNPVLIGEPGVGKTAIAEGLALRIINGDVPESLRDRRLLSIARYGRIDCWREVPR